MKYKLISERAQAPRRATIDSAGLDLYSAEEITLKHGKTSAVSTDLILMLPQNSYGRIADRSSLALFHSIHCLGGVVDSDYRGVVKVILHNMSAEDYNISVGDRIAQIIVEPYMRPDLQKIEVIDLTTERNTNGFGSSGI